MTTGFKNKTVTVLLASTLGSLGAHRFYLGGVRAALGWTYLGFFVCALAVGLRTAMKLNPGFGLNMPYDLFQPAVLLAAVPTVLAFLDAIILGLMSDARFDARYNCAVPQTNRSGGFLVALVVLSLLIGAGLMTTILAVDLQAMVEALPHHALDQEVAAPAH